MYSVPDLCSIVKKARLRNVLIIDGYLVNVQGERTGLQVFSNEDIQVVGSKGF